MQLPLEVTYRDIQKTEELDALIRRLASRLDHYCDHIDGCRVVVECPHVSLQTFRELRVRLDITVPPGHEVVVSRESAGGSTHDSVDALVRSAFQAARRRLIRLKHLQRQHSRPVGQTRALNVAAAANAPQPPIPAPRRRSTMTNTGLDVFDTTINRTNIWLKEIMEELGTDDRHRAYVALRATLHALRDRLTPDSAAALGAQLPMLVRGLYFEGYSPSGKPIRARHKEDFLLMVRSRIQGGLANELDLEEVVRAVFRVITRQVSEGETEKLRYGLPTELRELWSLPV